MSPLQISAYAVGFGFATVALLSMLVIALDRVADRDAEERRQDKEREEKRRRLP